MQLAEKHIIKSGHLFFEEIDALAFCSKNLYNAKRVRRTEDSVRRLRALITSFDRISSMVGDTLTTMPSTSS